MWRQWKTHAILSIAIMVAAGVILFLMGRVPFCRCGMVSVWSSDISSNQQSQQLADPYTVTHVIHGALFYGLLWLLVGARVSVPTRFVLAVMLEAGWEILENTELVINRYREATIALGYYGDSIMNSMGDIVAMMLGFWLASRLSVRATILGAIALDAILLLTIRDSLAVNILMLIYPSELIKHWQLR